MCTEHTVPTLCSALCGLFLNINIWEILLHLIFGKLDSFTNQLGFQPGWTSCPPSSLLWNGSPVWCYKLMSGAAGTSRTVFPGVGSETLLNVSCSQRQCFYVLNLVEMVISTKFITHVGLIHSNHKWKKTLSRDFWVQILTKFILEICSWEIRGVKAHWPKSIATGSFLYVLFKFFYD